MSETEPLARTAESAAQPEPAAPSRTASHARADHFTAGEPQAEATPPSPKRKALLSLLAAAVALSCTAYGAYYYTVGRFYESTDDAYVSGNLVQLTPRVSGTVVAVNADDTQIVRKGAPVVSLDSADARVALENAQATLARTVRQVSGLYANNAFYAATVAQRESDLDRALADLKRREVVAATGAVSGEDLAHARDTVAAARAALDAARQQAAANRALTDRTTIEQHPDVIAATAKVRTAYLDYARDTLPAPVTGYVAQRSVQVGQRVAPGKPLLAIVPLNEVWVDANFKEGQLRRMRIGQPVTLTADVYGSGVVYHGRVAGFSAGTGAAFAVLPAQNATGNWIKVVQRLPARIELDPRELAAHPLRLGLSMKAEVDTHADGGTQLGAAAVTTYRTDVFADEGAKADAEIAQIIARNMPLAHKVTP